MATQATLEKKLKLTPKSFKKKFKHSPNLENLKDKLIEHLVKLLPASDTVDKSEQPIQLRIRQGLKNGLGTNLLQCDADSFDIITKINEFLKNFNPDISIEKNRATTDIILNIQRVVKKLQEIEKEKENKPKAWQMTSKNLTERDLKLKMDRERLSEEQEKNKKEEQARIEQEKLMAEREKLQKEQALRDRVATSASFQTEKGGVADAPAVTEEDKLRASVSSANMMDPIAHQLASEKYKRELREQHQDQRAEGGDAEPQMPSRKDTLSDPVRGRVEPETLEPSISPPILSADVNVGLPNQTAEVHIPGSGTLKEEGQELSSEVVHIPPSETLKEGDSTRSVEFKKPTESLKVEVQNAPLDGENLSRSLGNLSPQVTLPTSSTQKAPDLLPSAQDEKESALPAALSQKVPDNNGLVRNSSFSVEPSANLVVTPPQLKAEPPADSKPLSLPKASSFFKPITRASAITGTIVALDSAILVAGFYFGMKLISQGNLLGGVLCLAGAVVAAIAVTVLGKKKLSEENPAIDIARLKHE